MNQSDLAHAVAKGAELKVSQAEELVDALFEVVGRELSVGESVEVEGLGKFYTEKSPSQTVEDPPGSGHMVIRLPVVRPYYESDPYLNKKVLHAVLAHPELFTEDQPEDGDEEEAAEPSRPELSGTLDSSNVPAPMPIAEEPQKTAPEKPLGRTSHIQFMDLSGIKVEKEVLQLVSQRTAKQYGAVPIDLKEGILTVAMVDPEDFDALQVVRKETGLTVRPVLTSKEDIGSVLDQYTGLQAELQEVIKGADFGFSKEDLEGASQEDLQDKTNENAPTAKIIYSLLRRAVKERASDVHIEPYENKIVVRFRLDGVLQPRVELPKEIQSAIASRLKILAELKIDEQRLPQDGRFNLIVEHRQIDFRLSTIPVVFGEKIVMRILDKAVGIISLEDVGLSGRGLELLTKNMRRSHGMILVTGPTGSGKTTTLYSVLGKLMRPDVNILTLEDPVEYRIESINQSQVHADIGYTFAAGLRAVVRQDPDVVMLGEIRDPETADMAIHAALTGHVVLSTLHTNDAAGAFPRLIDMNVEPFLITSSVHTIIAQRLARKICTECVEEYTIGDIEFSEVKGIIATMPTDLREQFAEVKPVFKKGKGCDVCNDKGYKGRAGIFEVLNVSEPIRDLVLKRSSGESITTQAVEEGMITMVQDGIIKAMDGRTTLEEVWRVTRE